MPHQCTNCGRTFGDGSKEMLSGCPDCGGNKFQFKPASAADGTAGDGVAAGTAATEPKKTPESARDSADDVRQAQRDAPSADDARTGAVNRAAATVRDWVGTRDETEPHSDRDYSEESADRTAKKSAERDRSDSTRNERADGAKSSSARPDSPAGPDRATRPDSPANSDAAPSSEDSAQASARSDVVNDSELPEDAPENAAEVGPTSEDADDANVVSAPDDDNPGLKELREELNSQFESIRIVNPGQYELNLMELYEREEYIISLQEDGKYVIEVPDAWDPVER
ncbi:OapC/ArvC family zinc-ribbon domain-containing protein [Halorussus pelagicus]|uniref:OapC/ArvC family zinc-ribbon domain-containing protein n=1 Tax=Halorussus pelagicus TaxID=2505977 RepID=UPI000FFC26CD|nr:Zn-ribbon containing protein [Halorussus pelagicus]